MPEKPHERLGLSLAALYYVARREYRSDLTHRAIRLLQFISYRDQPPRLDDVTAFLKCAPSTASELIKRLQTKKLLTRERSKSDERTIEIRLTEAGEAALTEHTSLDPQKLSDGLKALTAQERETLIASIDKMTRALG